MPTTTLQKTEREYETDSGTRISDQYESTIPKQLIEAMGWEAGDDLEWGIESGNKLSITEASD